MKPREKDVLREASGQMHSEAYPDTKHAAETFGRTRRTMQRWAAGQHGSVPFKLVSYVANAPNPWAVESELMAARKAQALAHLTDSELIHRYWEIRQAEADAENTDRKLDTDCPSRWEWMRMAKATKADVALNAEKAAVEMEFAKRGLSVERVLEELP